MWKRVRDLAGRRSVVANLWMLCLALAVLLLGAVAVKEARRTVRCTGPPRAEANTFTTALASGDRAAAIGQLASFASPIAHRLPALLPATQAELAGILDSRHRGGSGCVTVSDEASYPCFAYVLPARLTVDREGTRRAGFVVTVACDDGRWRVNGFA